MIISLFATCIFTYLTIDGSTRIIYEHDPCAIFVESIKIKMINTIFMLSPLHIVYLMRIHYLQSCDGFDAHNFLN